MKIEDPILAAEVARLKEELFDQMIAGKGTWPPAPARLIEEHGLAAHTCGQLDERNFDDGIFATATYRRDAWAMLLAELIETQTIARHDPLAAVTIPPPPEVAAELAAAQVGGGPLDARLAERVRAKHAGATAVDALGFTAAEIVAAHRPDHAAIALARDAHARQSIAVDRWLMAQLEALGLSLHVHDDLARCRLMITEIDRSIGRHVDRYQIELDGKPAGQPLEITMTMTGLDLTSLLG